MPLTVNECIRDFLMIVCCINFHLIIIIMGVVWVG